MTTTSSTAIPTADHLTPEALAAVQRHLVTKAISE